MDGLFVLSDDVFVGVLVDFFFLSSLFQLGRLDAPVPFIVVVCVVVVPESVEQCTTPLTTPLGKPLM